MKIILFPSWNFCEAESVIPLGRLLEISAGNVNELKQSIQQDSSGALSFPPRVVEIHDDADGHDLSLLTKVKKF
jgi:hypothetical protein